MSTMPPQLAALALKAHRIEHDQNACFHDWERVRSKIVLHDEWFDRGDVSPITGDQRRYMVNERPGLGHWHCEICNLRTTIEPKNPRLTTLTP